MKLFRNILVTASLLCGSFVSLGLATPVHASPFDGAKGEACKGANLSNTDSTCDKKQASETLDKRIQFIVNLLTTVIGIIAVIMIIINGLRFITANGDANSITAARNGVIYSIVGLIIVALAQIIVRFVLART